MPEIIVIYSSDDEDALDANNITIDDMVIDAKHLFMVCFDDINTEIINVQMITFPLAAKEGLWRVWFYGRRAWRCRI